MQNPTKKSYHFPNWFLTYNLKELFLKLIPFQMEKKDFGKAATFILAAIKEYGNDPDIIKIIKSSKQNLSRNEDKILNKAMAKEYMKLMNWGSIDDLLSIYYGIEESTEGLNFSFLNYTHENVCHYVKGFPVIQYGRAFPQYNAKVFSEIAWGVGLVSILVRRIEVRRKNHQNISLEMKKLKEQISRIQGNIWSFNLGPIKEWRYEEERPVFGGKEIG
jgi:hypothetical protein